MKTIKCMNILNGVYAAVCLISILGSSMNLLHYALVEHNAVLAQLCEALFPLGPLGAVSATLVPFGPIAWLVGLVCFFLHRRETEFKAAVGKKWIWLVAWPVLDAVLWMGAVGALVGFTGGV